jgi:Mrp family chromosome partitioning ATPase
VSLDGAVVVVGPQDVAHLDARKFLTFLREADVPVLGAVENMSGLQCPHCGELIEVFTPVTEARSVWAEGVSLLGRIPLDPALGAPDAFSEAQSEAFDAVAAQVFDTLQRREAA